MQPSYDPIITITTISGERASAPLLKWVQAMILSRTPEELQELMSIVNRSESPIISHLQDTVPGDPKEWLSGNGRRT